MSNIAIITDIHIGARSDSLIFCDHQIKFFTDVFIPYLKENKIGSIICMGDLFDRRKFTNHVILHKWKTKVFDNLKEFNIHLILGNHDIAYRNTLEVNSPNLFLQQDYQNIRIYDSPTEINIDGTLLGLIPWICQNNYDNTFEFFKETKARVLFGHFEINGFEMHRGQYSTEGLDQHTFDKFYSVYSGHFHHRSSSKNIHYIGNPYELTWADYDDPRGFCIFNTSTLDHEFINNPQPIHYKIEYDDINFDYSDYNFGNLDNCFVKLVCVNKTDLYKFDIFLNKLYSLNIADLKIVESFEDFLAENVSDEHINLQDTVTLIDTYIDSVDVECEKSILKAKMKSLYIEASHL